MEPYTTQLCKDTISQVTNQYFDMWQPFAVPRYGNECTSYVTGRDYMKAVADAIRGASRFIFIADWQLDYDVELDNRGESKHSGRLSELLADALDRGVHIRVLCYDSVDIVAWLASKIGANGPADNHEEETQKYLDGHPPGKGSIKVMLQNPNTGKPITAGQMNSAFSHHQKFVVIDGHTAFLGGMDLAYGRWETPAFNVVVDPNIHVLNDAYNQQIIYARDASANELSLTHKQQNGRLGFVPPLYANGHKLLDPLTQPRQPWNDVAVGIKGPGAFDVFVNFVLRWNSAAGGWSNFLVSPLRIDWFESVVKGHETLVDPLKKGEGSAIVQVCRSIASEQLKDELELWSSSKKYVRDDWKQPNPARRKIMEEARKAWAWQHQTSILEAMTHCIRSAKGYIYIETQFFVSDCGADIHGTNAPAKNKILMELSMKICQAIYAEQPFHVWLVLPEQPEGMLEAEAVTSQAWWALQGVKHGDISLIHNINKALVAKNKTKWAVDKAGLNNADTLAILKNKGMENKWREYLTVLNLRNYGCSSNNVLTEMIYVHSKLLIVDDAVAIIGSANINDRSLMGDGDSELASVIVDNADVKTLDIGQGINVVTRKFARELRIKLWKKHFAMSVDGATTGVQKENSPPLGINLEQPLSKKTISGIQQQATINREAYNRVFTHTPRNTFDTLLDGLKHYPRKTRKIKKYEVNGVPVGNVNPNGSLREGYILVDEPTTEPDISKNPALQTAYMKHGRHNIDSAIKELRGTVKGFFVEMPLDWGINEQNTPKNPFGGNQMIASIDNPSTEVLDG
jgi:phospholipase D1/2